MKLILFALSLVVAQVSGQPATTGSIRGQVVDAGAGEAIADADVLLQPAGNNRSDRAALHAKADRDGRFEVSGLAPGAYVLTVQQDGFFAMVNGAMETASDVRVVVEAGGSPPELTIVLNRAAVISGRVIDGAGQLLPQARVRAFAVMREGEGETIKPAAAVTKFSDNRGEYRLFWLLPGEYVIQAEPPDSATGMAGTSLMAFHPNSITLESAARIVLHAGDSLSGVDITLPLAVVTSAPKALKISGQVLSALTADGRAVPAGSALLLLPHDSVDTSSPRNAGRSDSRTGRFEISSVAPGVYDLYARVQDPRGSPSHRGVALAWARAVVEVRDADVENVRLVVHASVTVQGVVKMAGNSGALPSGLRVELERLGSSARLQNVQGMTDVTQGLRSDGSFTIAGVAEGTYKIRVIGLPSDAVVVGVWQAGREITESGFEVKSTDPPPIEVRIRRGK